jgi:conjugal transfer pilus assembly protein TraF
MSDIRTALISYKIFDRALFFYKGGSVLSQKMATSLLPFIKEYHFSMISITTDQQFIEGLPHSKSVSITQMERMMNIKAKYLPALFLVDIKNQKMSPFAYGFISLSDLKDRILDVLTDFRRLSYEGLGE